MVERGEIVLEANVPEEKEKNVDNNIAEKIGECFRKLDNYNREMEEIVEIIKSKRVTRAKTNIESILKMHIIRKVLNLNRWKICFMVCCNDELKEMFGIQNKTRTVYDLLYRMERIFNSKEIEDKIARIIDSLESEGGLIVDIKCPYCDSINIEKAGCKEENGKKIKVYRCSSCGKKFINEKDCLSPEVRERILDLWIEENKSFDSIAEIIRCEMGNNIDVEAVENVVDKYLIENLNDLPQNFKKKLVRRLVFRYSNLSMSEITKLIDTKYNYKVLMRTVVNWLKEKKVIEKYGDMIRSMARNGHTAKDISYWLEKNEGIFIDPMYLEDDIRRMENERV